MKAIAIWALLLMAAHSVLGCGSDRGLPEVTREEVAGVEIISFGELPSLLDPEFAWTASVDLEIPTEWQGADPIVYDPVALVPLDDQTLLTVDRHGDEVVVLIDIQTARAVARFGQGGSGPGELSGRVSPLLAEDGTIWMVDHANRKSVRFSRVGEVMEEVPLSGMSSGGKRVVQAGRGLFIEESDWVEPGRFNRKVSKLDPSTGGTISLVTLPEPNQWSPTTGVGIQFGRSLWTALRYGVVTTRSDRASYWVHQDDGRLVRELRLPLSQRTLSELDITGEIQRHGPIARTLEVGEIAITNELYAFNDSVFAMYQSALWHAAEDPEPSEGMTVWRLISIDGAYKGTFSFPSDFKVLWAEKGVIWGVIPDSTGIPVIQRWVLSPPPVLSR